MHAPHWFLWHCFCTAIRPSHHEGNVLSNHFANPREFTVCALTQFSVLVRQYGCSEYRPWRSPKRCNNVIAAFCHNLQHPVPMCALHKVLLCPTAIRVPQDFVSVNKAYLSLCVHLRIFGSGATSLWLSASPLTWSSKKSGATMCAPHSTVSYRILLQGVHCNGFCCILLHSNLCSTEHWKCLKCLSPIWLRLHCVHSRNINKNQKF